MAEEVGRPSLYSKELADKICFEIASTTQSLKRICMSKEFPCHATVFNWLSNNEEFLDLYTRAKEMQSEMLIDEMIEISDDATNDFMTIQKGDNSYEMENKEWTSRSKLRIETRKWIAAKLLPKKYSDRIQQDINLNGAKVILTGAEPPEGE